jgi:hypothetical protein
MRSIHRGDPQTLGALFFGELWRGRDNLRVSLRAPITWRSLPSIAIPIVNLCALLAAVVGLATLPFGDTRLIELGVAVFMLLTVIRAASLLWQVEPAERSIARVSQALAVAAVYNLARSLALVVRSGHDARRSVQASP